MLSTTSSIEPSVAADLFGIILVTMLSILCVLSTYATIDSELKGNIWVKLSIFLLYLILTSFSMYALFTGQIELLVLKTGAHPVVIVVCWFILFTIINTCIFHVIMHRVGRRYMKSHQVKLLDYPYLAFGFLGGVIVLVQAIEQDVFDPDYSSLVLLSVAISIRLTKTTMEWQKWHK